MITRANEIAYLEQHWSRQLAMEMVDYADAIIKVCDSVLPAEARFRTLKAIAGDIQNIAEQSRLSVETAKLIPDELLADYVRHEASPNWRTAMEERGYKWDAKRLRWTEGSDSL